MLPVDNIKFSFLFFFAGLPNKEMSAMALGLAHRWVHISNVQLVPFIIEYFRRRYSMKHYFSGQLFLEEGATFGPPTTTHPIAHCKNMRGLEKVWLFSICLKTQQDIQIKDQLNLIVFIKNRSTRSQKRKIHVTKMVALQLSPKIVSLYGLGRLASK